MALLFVGETDIIRVIIVEMARFFINIIRPFIFIS